MLILTVAVQSTACGKLTEYQTEHDCGIYTIKSFKDFEALTQFKDKESMKSVAKRFDDFCYWGGGVGAAKGYAASVPVDLSGLNKAVKKVRLYERYENNPEMFKGLEECVDEEINGIVYPDGSENGKLRLLFNADMELIRWELTDEYHEGGGKDGFSTIGAIGEYKYLLDSNFGEGTDNLIFTDALAAQGYIITGLDLPTCGYITGSILYESAGNGTLELTETGFIYTPTKS